MPRSATPTSLEPIRGEIFGAERLAQHAQSLAGAHRVHPQAPRKGAPLLDRFEDNARALLQAYRALAEEVQHERAISPAAEWLIDNFHIVDEQVIEIREAIPSGYYRVLPKLAGVRWRITREPTESRGHSWLTPTAASNRICWSSSSAHTRR